MPPVAVAVGMGLVGAATSAYGAKKASDASKDAARQQQQAAQQAQAFNERAWQAQQTALKPYQEAGQQSLAALMQRQGAQGMDQRVNGYVQQAQMGMHPQFGGAGQSAGRPADVGMSLGQMAGGDKSFAGMAGKGQAAQGAGLMAGGAPQMVRVKAPTGEMAMLPANSPQLSMALQRGAVQL